METMLREYASRKAELEELRERIAELRSAIENPRATAPTGMPSAHNDKAAEDGVIRLVHLMTIYEGKVRELEWSAVRAEQAIASLPSLPRRVMRMVYVQGLSYSEVGRRIGYSTRQVKRIHDSALSKLDRKPKREGF